MSINEQVNAAIHTDFDGKAELAMDHSFWESFIDHSADAIGLFDLDGNILKLNKATETVFGYSREELIGNKVVTIPDESYREEVVDLQNRVKAGESIKDFETLRKKKDGTIIDVSITYSPVMAQNGKVIAMANILRDITSQKKAREELQKSEAKYRLIAENTADLIRILNLDGQIIYASPSHVRTLGRDSKYYERIRDFSFIHPHDLPVIGEQFQSMIIDKSPIHLEYRELHNDGHWVSLEAHCTPVINETNRIDSIVMVVRDQTERKHTEELLRNSDKLAVIGQMAASIAHEIRNPLTSLKGFLQFLHSNSGRGTKHYYELMLSELERINLIVSEFLLLAKPQVVRFQKTCIKRLLDHILTLINTQAIEENIEIETSFAERLPEIECDENQLKQAFLNYLKNAIEASEPGGKIVVTIDSDDHFLKVKVVDHGHGMPKDTFSKIGMPFFTTKRKGTGLGLMISQKIIANHKGSVEFDSKQNNGTTVTISLPVTRTIYVKEE
ncbi:PAS domain-containing sensor histidine kinase [Alkalihalobacillus sp. AL-G]|uniref:PAS domain-containing sensor histidine kinase n=1 Tax=Alkalihalobacillus sp. AL-G TaxID=2926399 RepID=UPI00272D4301|nr:PAS domain-containing sensor histidine kinase [Alkalihalobacillus sp. AL-G]WLD91554.1 PAS domain S-box protein [Alkalihalobacillus sp. AL-G]